MFPTSFASLAAGMLSLLVCVFSSSAQDYNVWFDSAHTVTDSIIPGDWVRCDVYLNTDAADTLDSVKVGIYLSEDSIVDTADFLFRGTLWKVSTIAAVDEGEQRKIAYLDFPTDVTYGPKYLLFDLDSDDDHAETDEEDNFAVHAMRIVEPDIDVSYKIARFAEDTIDLGDTLEFHYSFRNDGSTTAYPMTTIIYLSEDSTVDLADRVLYSYDRRYLYPFHNTGTAQSYFPDKILLETFPVFNTTVYGIFTIEAPDYLNETNLDNNVTVVPLYLRGDSAMAVVPLTHTGRQVTGTAARPVCNLLGQMVAPARAPAAPGVVAHKGGTDVRVRAVPRRQ